VVEAAAGIAISLRFHLGEVLSAKLSLRYFDGPSVSSLTPIGLSILYLQDEMRLPIFVAKIRDIFSKKHGQQ